MKRNSGSTGVFLVVPMCALFGAGTCGKYLLREFAKRGPVFWDAVPGDEVLADSETRRLIEDHHFPLVSDVDIPLISFAGPDGESQPHFRGKPHVGYVFTETEVLTVLQVENLSRFDRLIAGSEWNASVLKNFGLHCEAVQQGVDCEVFKPLKRIRWRDRFVVYSGGQFSKRKAQDLVIRAVSRVQKDHPDILLVASWFNSWTGCDGYDEAEKEVELIGLPLVDQKRLAFYMNQTDIGVFPNRAEGGTNLVMMDYLACGKPVIARYCTGQMDVLRPNYAFLTGGDDETTVGEMVEAIEYAYNNRGRKLREMGVKARNAMLKWTWSRTAEGIERVIHS